MSGAAWEFGDCGVYSAGGVALMALRGAEVALDACRLGAAPPGPAETGRGPCASYGLVVTGNSSASLQARLPCPVPAPLLLLALA